MKKQLTVKEEYNSLDKILEFAKKETSYECSKDYDSWDLRTDSNDQMEQCVIIKKSSMHGIKLYFSEKNTLDITYIIPSKLLHAFFGKSEEKHQKLSEVIFGKINDLLLTNSQKKAFDELLLVLEKVSER